MEKQEIIKRLWKDARYAVNSLSRPLIYKTLGELSMAVDLKAVSYEDVKGLYRYLIRDTLNNPVYLHKLNNANV